MKDKYLILENGKVFKGRPFGADGEVLAETVFTTGMTGYLETITDKSYFGQIVAQTFPLIGNYGVIQADFESDKPALFGYIARDDCAEPSNFRSGGRLDDFLRESGVVGIKGVDTRTLTKIIRESGVMNGAIADKPDADFEKLKSYKVENAVNSVTTRERFVKNAENPEFNVVLWDFGLKKSIIDELVKRRCNVAVLPASSTADDILRLKPDGVMLSNGPGDPAENTGVINNLRALIKTGQTPIFGICLGHQLMALANGIGTYKLKYGHRGANQPAKHITTGRVYITSQNHGYATDASCLPQGVKPLFVNVNDGTCEGLFYEGFPAFSVQFHPEASAGPKDTAFLFDNFLGLMRGKQCAI